MVQRRAARFVMQKQVQKNRYSVTAMLDELGNWPILSKRRKDARLILFYKIINNLAQVPHEHILTKAYEGTRKKNNHKFRHILVNTRQYTQWRIQGGPGGLPPPPLEMLIRCSKLEHYPKIYTKMSYDGEFSKFLLNIL